MASQNRPENLASTLEALSVYAQRDQLEPPETYRAALDVVVNVLSQQGGLLHLPDLPTIIFPDLHSGNRIDGPAWIRGLKIVDIQFDGSNWISTDTDLSRKILVPSP